MVTDDCTYTYTHAKRTIALKAGIERMEDTVKKFENCMKWFTVIS